MTDTTTTEEATQSQGVDQTQPEGEQATTAEGQNEQTATTEQETTEPAQADNPDDWQGWLQAKGVDPTDPDAVGKVAKMAREAEKAMHGKAQKASELKKTLESQPAGQVSENPLTQQLFEEVVALKRSTATRDFKSEVKLTPAQEAKMVDYLASNPEKVQLINAGYMSLKDAYTLSGAGSIDPEAAKREGKQEALQQLANKQRVTSVSGDARTPGVTPPKDDPFLAGFNQK